MAGDILCGLRLVPILWRYEVSAVLAKAQKNGIISKVRANSFLAQLADLNITVDAESAARVLTDVHRLATAYQLTSYDAAYLEVAVRYGIPMATLDDELIAACTGAGAALL